MKQVSFVIEDEENCKEYAFMLAIGDNFVDTIAFKGCDLADIDDDYVFDSDNLLFRLMANDGESHYTNLYKSLQEDNLLENVVRIDERIKYIYNYQYGYDEFNDEKFLKILEKARQDLYNLGFKVILTDNRSVPHRYIEFQTEMDEILKELRGR